jgi:hypothetical protein
MEQKKACLDGTPLNVVRPCTRMGTPDSPEGTLACARTATHSQTLQTPRYSHAGHALFPFLSLTRHAKWILGFKTRDLQ